MTKSKTMMAYQALKQDLLNGIHAPGSKLRIEQICESLKVSPGAVRESLSRLTADGLVVAAEQRGFIAAPISSDDLIDLTAVRISIECKCLDRAITIGDLAWEAGIVASWHRLSKSTPISQKTPEVVSSDWAEAHNAFHDSLVAGSDSAWWLRLRGQLFMQAERYRRLLLPHTNVARNIDHEHQLIMDATLARDRKKAADAMRAHLQHTADILLAADALFADRSGTSK